LETIKVIVENNFVGEASNLSEAANLARKMAYRLGYSGGNIHVKYINKDGSLVGMASIYVS
jgi:hypothetical protein